MLCFYCPAKWMSYTYTYTPSLLDVLPIQVTTERWVESPVLYSRFSLVIYATARSWKQPKCPSAEEWIKKRWCIYSMDCYSATKRKEPGSLLLLMRAFILGDVSFLFLLSPFASLSSPWFVLSVSLSHKVHAFFILVMTLRTWFLKFTSVS